MTDAHGEDNAVEMANEAGPRGRRAGRTTILGLAVAALLVGGAGLGLALSDRGSDSGASVPKAATCTASTPRLTVEGTGQASAPPDVLTAVLAFNATAPSASAALSQDNAEVGASVLALAVHGVSKSDIQTTGLTLQTVYAYPKGVPTVTGYQVSNTVTATLRDMAKAGAAIDAVVGEAGDAAQINSLAFSFSNPGQVQNEARAHAVRQAVARARAMAAAAGRRLGPVCSLTDSTPTQNVVNNNDLTQASAGLNSAAVPIEAGTQSESDQITLVYALTSR